MGSKAHDCFTCGEMYYICIVEKWQGVDKVCKQQLYWLENNNTDPTVHLVQREQKGLKLGP